MANGTNVGNVELKVTLNKEHITQELLKTFENCQSQAEKNTITYKIAGDKSSLDAMLKQIQGLTPELLAKLKLDFDKSDYDKEMAALKNTTGKTAKQIGDEFKDAIGSSLKDFNVSQVIGKKIGKNDLLNVKDISKIKDVLQSLMQQTEGFDLSKVTSVKAINDQVFALNKMKVLLDALSNHSEQKSIKINEKTFNISQMLQQNTSSIDNIMQQAGSVIHTNAQKWMTDLENTFNTEYGSIISLLENLGKGVQNVLGGSGSRSGSGGNGTSKELEELEKQITNVTQKIQEAEAELEKLKSKKNSNTESPVKIEDIGKSVENLSGNLVDSKYDKEAKNLLTLVEAWKSAGNSITELERKFPNFSARLKEVTEAGYKANKPKTQVIDTKAIENQQRIVDNLKSSLESLMAKKKELEIQTSVGSPGTGTGNGTGNGNGTGSGNGTPTTATVSPQLSEDFKTKLQEQVTNMGAVDVSINGKLSETFKDDVQNNVNSLGSVDMGVSFSNQKKEGEAKQEIPVDVIATPKLADTFKDDLQKKVDELGTYEVKVDLKQTDKEKDKDAKDESIPINIKPNNIEDFKSQLKSGVEGDNGLDIKVNPIIPEDFNLEIKNATLKDVKVEGDINGGNLKPTTVEAPVVTPPVVDGTGQNDVNAKLDETKKKQEEVGNAAVESGEKQKRSLLEVIKEYEKLDAESVRLLALDDKNSQNNEMQQFLKQKQEAAREYNNIQELVAKIQSKVAEKTSKSATSLDKTKQLAGIIAYVERLKELMGNGFSYDVLGENGEAKFNNMKQIVDAATKSVGDNQQTILDLNQALLKLGKERDGLLAVATDAEKLELQLYETAKSFKSNGSAINTTTGKFKEFLELWKQYKSVGGNKKFSEFTDNAKLINATTREYNKFIEAKAEDERKSQARKDLRANMMAEQYSAKYSDIDKNQFDGLINKLREGLLTAKEFEAEIVKIREASKDIGKDNGATTTSGQNPQSPTKLNGSGEINVVPKVEDPSAFTTAVSTQLGSNSAEINTIPKVEDPALFASQVTEQLKGVSAEINVKPNLVWNNNIANEQSAQDKNIENQIKNYDSMIQKMQEYINLQKEINNGNYQILEKHDNGRYWNVHANDTTKSSKYTVPTGVSVKKQLDRYLNYKNSDGMSKSADREKEILASYVAAFNNADKAQSIFGKKNKEIFSEIQTMIENAKKSMEAYTAAQSKLSGILHNAYNLTDKTSWTLGERDQFENILNTGNIENSIKFLQEHLGIQIPAAANKAKTAIDGIGEQTKQEGQEIKSQTIQIPLEANIESLNTSIQSKKDQILPVDVKLNGILSSTSTDTNVGTTGMTHETEQAEILRQKITEITTAVDAKTNAFRQEGQVVNGTVQSEISMLEALDGQLYIILQTIQKIQATPITLNVKVSDDFYNSESKVNSVIEELKTSLSGIDSAMLQNLTSVLKALSIKDSTAKNVQKLANAILNLKSNLNNVSIGGTQFLNDIKELANQAEGIKALATVIKASKEEIQKAKDVISETKAKENPINVQATEIAKGTREWDLIEKAALKYKSTLGDIQKITYSMRQDKDGKELKSYRITGSKSSVTFGENLNKVAESETKTFQKTATEINKIRNDFIQAATKSNLNFNLDSLKVDKNGVITFTSTVEKLGEEAVTTKYKIENLYEKLEKGIRNNGQVAINANGTLNKNYLNQHVDGSVTTKGLATRSSSIKDVDRVTGAYTHLISTEERYQKLRAKIDNNTATKKQIEEFNVLTALRKKDNDVLNQTTVLTEKQMQLQRSYQKEVEKANITYESVLTHGGGTRVENIGQAQEEATRINDALTRTQQLMSQLSNSKVEGFDQIFARAKAQVDELNKKLIAGDITNIQTGYEDKINKIVSSLKNVVAVSLPGDIKTANEEMLKYASTLNNGQVQIGNFSSGNKVLNASFKTQKGIIKEVSLVYDELSGSISLVEKGTKRVKTVIQAFADGLKKRFSSLAQYLVTFVSFYRIIAIIKQGITYIKEFDTALTEMRKVSDETVSSLKNFQKVSFDIANTVGTTAKQIQNSTADFMRLGESLKEATNSAKVANTLLNVSEFESIDAATESLISMSAAYSELEKQDIVDKLNEVGNNYAISTDGIATALQTSASALKTASNDMDEAIALVTAGNAVVQDPNSVGSGLRTIALRLTGTKEAKSELEELGEDTENVATTVSKLRDTIMSATKVSSNGFKGFDILDENGNYKSTYEILKGISAIYEEIVETDKKNGTNNLNLLLETMAGKNRSNIAASILQNNELLESAYNSSANDSQGSAQEELDKYLDSIEGKMAQFKNEVQEFWYNLISSETVKKFVDFGTKAMDIIGKLTDKIGVLGTTFIASMGVFKAKDILTGNKSGGRAKLCKV